jgi:hypothetical protein
VSNQRIATVFLCIALAAGLGTWGAISWWHRWTEWPPHRMLPQDAADVHEWSWEDGLLPDYTYLLKARISQDEFAAYVAHFHLTPHTADRVYTDDADIWFSWDGAADWWDPSEERDGSFVRQEGDRWTYAKYERGYLYFKSLEH